MENLEKKFFELCFLEKKIVYIIRYSFLASGIFVFDEIFGKFVILSLLQKGEKSIEFKARFEFMDTSLRSV